jgi:tetratricopeptide (TPR) repeat protein
MRKCVIALILVSTALLAPSSFLFCPITHADETAPAIAAPAEEPQAETPGAAMTALWRVLSALYLRQGEPDKAVDCLEQVCALNPDDPAPLSDLINLSLRVQQYETAKAALNTLYERNPGHRYVLLALAACCSGLKDEKYRDYLEKADASDFPGNPYIDSAAYFEQFGLTGLVYEELGNEIALPLTDPKNSPALRIAALEKMAFYLSDEGKYAEAARMYGRMLAEMELAGLAASGGYRHIESQMRYCEAMQAERDGDAARALLKCQKAVRLDPSDMDAVEHLYLLLKKQGNEDDAKRVFDTAEAALLARAAGETDAAAMNNLAWFYAVTGMKIDEGIRLARKAVESRPEEPAFLDTLAELNYVKAQTQEGNAKTESVKNAHRYAQLAYLMLKKENVRYYERQYYKMLLALFREFIKTEGPRIPR